MNEKKQKRWAFFLYFAYAISLTLLLIFGKNVAHWAQSIVRAQLEKVHITDVVPSVTEDEELLAGKLHYIDYASYGDIRGDDGLVFESLDPEYLTVSGRGRLKASADFEGDVFKGRVRVTSEYDDKFEKIFTFTFVKKYPEKFCCAFFVRGYAHSSKTIYVGIPVYVFSHIEDGVSYNVRDYEILYDEEYFERADDGAFIPVKTSSEKMSFTVRYANGATDASTEFVIEEAPVVTEFEDVYLDGVPASEYVGSTGEGIIVTLVGKDGKAVPTVFTVTYEEGEKVVHSAASHPIFKTPGDKQVTYTLPNGFSKTITIKIRNELVLPTVTDKAVSDSHVINMLDTDVRTVNVTFPSSAPYKKITLEYDEDMMSISKSGLSFVITPKKHGTSTLKIVVDDGFSRVEDVYTVEIEKNNDIIAVIWKNVSVFVSKVLGHITLFACLAVLAMNMFRFVYILNPVKRFIAYLFAALPYAAITEYAQTFIPGRSGRVQDVLIDMVGFLLGTLVVLIARSVSGGVTSVAKGIELSSDSKRRKGRRLADSLKTKKKTAYRKPRITFTSKSIFKRAYKEKGKK